MKRNRFGQAAILSPQDTNKIRRELRSDAHKLFFDIARYTGERWGAIAQLQVGDVYADPALSLPRAEIAFRASTRKASPDGKRETRQIPIHPDLQQILQFYRPSTQASDWLFPSPASNQSITFSAADKWFRAAIGRAGLEQKGYSTHSTRRTLITRLANNGTAIKVIAAITGHRDVKSLMRYIEVSPEQISSALAMV